MTPTAQDLARRLVAAPWWRWRNGMSLLSDGRRWRLVAVVDGHHQIVNAHHSMWVVRMHRNALPDLTDPATVGVLLARLVDADPSAGWSLGCGPDVGWRCTSSERDISGDTAGEAVAQALLAVLGEAPDAE